MEDGKMVKRKQWFLLLLILFCAFSMNLAFLTSDVQALDSKGVCSNPSAGWGYSEFASSMNMSPPLPYWTLVCVNSGGRQDPNLWCYAQIACYLDSTEEWILVPHGWWYQGTTTAPSAPSDALVCQSMVLPPNDVTNPNPDAKSACQSDDEGLGDPCSQGNANSTEVGSSANLKSGNLYYSQRIDNITLSFNSNDSYYGPLGSGWTFNYNFILTSNNNSGLTLKEGNGNYIIFTLSNGIYKPAITSGDTSTIIKNTDGSYTRTLKNGINQVFDSTGKLSTVIDRNGKTTTFTYSGNNLTSITDPNGRLTTFTYSANQMTAITTSSGVTYTLAYAGHMLGALSDPDGNTWYYYYDQYGRMSGRLFESPDQSISYLTSYSYDESGRFVSSTDPGSLTKSISYNATTNTSTVVERDGGVWTQQYDATLNLPIQKTDQLGNVTKYSRDSRGNLLSETYPDGSIKSYTYDSNSNMTSVTDPLGNKTSYTYNSLNLVATIIDPKGAVTTYQYDSRGNLTKITDPLGASKTLKYDARGNIISVTDSKGSITALTYDTQNNLTSIKDPLGNIASFTYDAAGNRLSITDPLGNVTRYGYNILNQMTQVTDPSGNITRFTYDYNGNVLSTADANSNTTNYTYNYRGQVTQITDALNNITQLNYGVMGCSSGCSNGGEKLSALTDALGYFTLYYYDLLGRLTAKGAGGQVTYQYDSRGNVTLKTKVDGTSIEYTYDSNNRLLSKQYSDGTTTQFNYDANNNIIYAGNQNIAYNFAYDANNGLTGATDSNNRSIYYKYDSSGNRTQMISPDGKVTSYGYDANNRLAIITNDTGTYAFSYDHLNRRTKQINPNGTMASYTYDKTGRLLSITHKGPRGNVIASASYTYDKVGNRKTKNDNRNHLEYEYDAVYQLLQAKEGTHVIEAYSYDPVGERLTGPSSKTDYYYGYAHDLLGFTHRKNNTTYDTDSNGNILTKTEPDGTIYNYTYDIDDRLINVEIIKGHRAKEISYAYDPFGRRISKTIKTKRIEPTPPTPPGPTPVKLDLNNAKFCASLDIYAQDIKSPCATKDLYASDYIVLNPDSLSFPSSKTHGIRIVSVSSYFYDGANMIAEYNENGDMKAKYSHNLGIDLPLSVQQGKNVYWYHADGLGSIVALSDKHGFEAQEYSYDSFGNIKSENGIVDQPYTYTGREWDKETGLYYYRARYYDPLTGRFMQKDPIGFSAGDVNLYRYVGNNPVNFLDPFGLEPLGGPNATIVPPPPKSTSPSRWKCASDRTNCELRAMWEYETCMRGDSRDLKGCQTNKDNCFTRLQERYNACVDAVSARCSPLGY